MIEGLSAVQGFFGGAHGIHHMPVFTEASEQMVT